MLATSGAASLLPWYAILCLPILFTAGMSLFDTLQGAFMTAAYRWAFERPGRRIGYNLVVTGLSVIVASVIGTLEVLGLLGDRLSLQGPLWTWVSSLDSSLLGFGVAALFAAIWLVATGIWKHLGIGERPTVPADPAAGNT